MPPAANTPRALPSGAFFVKKSLTKKLSDVRSQAFLVVDSFFIVLKTAKCINLQNSSKGG